MAIKSIFVPFFDEKSAGTAFASAKVLADQTKAHISALHVRRRPIPPTNVYFPLGGVSTDFAEAFQNAEDALATALREIFVKACEDDAINVADMAEHKDEHGVSASWRESEGDILMEFAQCAIAHDLSVVAAAGDDATSFEEDIVEALLFRSGRPVLLCPEGGLAETPKTVVVAWNGSEEAARAVSGSLSLLCDVETVKVITVRKAQTPMINTDEITAYLRLHGVEAAAAEIEVTGGESATERLDQEIREANPDLLVMGAYSHSRWREAMLGGFTRHMIHRAKVPVLMMH